MVLHAYKSTRTVPILKVKLFQNDPTWTEKNFWYLGSWKIFILLSIHSIPLCICFLAYLHAENCSDVVKQLKHPEQMKIMSVS